MQINASFSISSLNNSLKVNIRVSSLQSSLEIDNYEKNYVVRIKILRYQLVIFILDAKIFI